MREHAIAHRVCTESLHCKLTLGEKKTLAALDTYWRGPKSSVVVGGMFVAFFVLSVVVFGIGQICLSVSHLKTSKPPIRRNTRKQGKTHCFLVFRRIGEYFSLGLFYFVSLTSSCSLIPCILCAENVLDVKFSKIQKQKNTHHFPILSGKSRVAAVDLLLTLTEVRPILFYVKINTRYINSTIGTSSFACF